MQGLAPDMRHGVVVGAAFLGHGRKGVHGSWTQAGGRVVGVGVLAGSCDLCVSRVIVWSL